MKLSKRSLRKLVLEELATARRPSLTSLIFEKSVSANVTKGRKSDTGYNQAAQIVQDEMDIHKGPTDIRAFLNGPGKDPKVRSVLAGGQTDGSPDDEAISPQDVSVAVGSLTPTQSEIELTKSIAYPLAVFEKGMVKSAAPGVHRVGPPGNDQIVISGKLIVDGHHRWSSLFAIGGPDAQIAAIDLGIPENDAASVLATTQVAIASTLRGGEALPAADAGESNILGQNKDSIKKLIESAVESGAGEKGPMLVDKFVQACIDNAIVAKTFNLSEGMSVKDARAAIIDKVADNLGQLPQPASGAPPREDMPQLDAAKGGVKGVMKAFEDGKVNYKEPFAHGTAASVKSSKGAPAAQNDSYHRQGTVVVERWQRLAGIIKG